MNNIKYNGNWDGQPVWRKREPEEKLLNVIEESITKLRPCEFCTAEDTPCRMHYNSQLLANCGPVEYNKPAKGNF